MMSSFGYLHTFKCGECLHFQTEHCPWKATADSIANPDCFSYTNPTISGTGTGTISLIEQGNYTSATTNNTDLKL